MSYAYRCETCHQMPWWRIERTGDTVITWACTTHLGQVCWALQRPFHETELLIKHNYGGVDNTAPPTLELHRS